MQDHVPRTAQDQIQIASHLASHLVSSEMLLDKAMGGVQQMLELNLNLARATLEQSNFAVRQLMSAKDAQHLVSLVAAQVQPNARRALDYGYYFTTITSGLQADVIKIAGAIIADINRILVERGGDLGKPAAGK